MGGTAVGTGLNAPDGWAVRVTSVIAGNCGFSIAPTREPQRDVIVRTLQAVEDMSEKDISKRIKQMEKQMLEHARNLEFEKAARVRDQLAHLREQAFGAPGTDNVVLSGPATAPTPKGRKK